MVKFYYYLPGLLLLASCSHTPQPQRAVDGPIPAVRASAVPSDDAAVTAESASASDRLQASVARPNRLKPRAPTSPADAPTSPERESVAAVVDTLLSPAQSEPALPRDKPSVARTENLASSEPPVPEAELAQTEKIEAVAMESEAPEVEIEVKAPEIVANVVRPVDEVQPPHDPEPVHPPATVEESSPAVSVVTQPEVESAAPPARVVSEAEPVAAVVKESEAPETNRAGDGPSPELEAPEAEADAKSVPAKVLSGVKPTPAEAMLPEKEAGTPRVPKGYIRTELTVVTTTNTALYFYAGDQLIASIPEEQLGRRGVSYVGPKELDLWKPANGVAVDASQILEWVGTLTLPEDASRCVVFAEETTHSDSDNFQFVAMADGAAHRSERNLCFVNLTSSDLKVRMLGADFKIPSFSHYDGSSEEAIAGRASTHVEVHTDGSSPRPLFAGSASGPWPKAPVLLLTGLATDHATVTLKALDLSGRSGELLFEAEPAPEALPPSQLEALQPLQPAVTPGTRTF